MAHANLPQLFEFEFMQNERACAAGQSKENEQLLSGRTEGFIVAILAKLLEQSEGFDEAGQRAIHLDGGRLVALTQTLMESIFKERLHEAAPALFEFVNPLLEALDDCDQPVAIQRAGEILVDSHLKLTHVIGFDVRRRYS